MRYDVMVPKLRRVEIKPDSKMHNPDPVYLRSLVESTGLSLRETARRIGLSWNGFSNYLRDENEPLYRRAPYTVQFALECLAHY